METGAQPSNCYLQHFRFLVTDTARHQTQLTDGSLGLVDWSTDGLPPGTYSITLRAWANPQGLGAPYATGGGGGGRCSPCRQQ